MDRLIIVFCAVFLISQFSFEVVIATRRFDGTSETNEKEEDGSNYSLFTSKQERRKRGSRKETDQQSDEELAELLKAYEDSPLLALVAINGKDKLVCKYIKGIKRSRFISRLGRNIDDDLPNENDKWLQDNDNVAEYMIQRSPPFAPRLGKRKTSLYAPIRLDYV